MAGLWQIVVPFDADDTNECTNPSCETGTTGFSASGTNTIAQSTEQQYRGRYSLKCTYQNNTTLATLAHTFGTVATTYYVKVKVYLPANWDGGTLSIGSSGYTSATTTAVKTWATTPTGTWVELKTTVTLALDASGSLTVSTTGSPTAGRYIYLDAWYISTNDGEYFDGDEPLAYWDGARHAAGSVMDFRNRKHGKATNLDDLAVYLGFPRGFDFPPFKHVTRQRARGRGSEFQTTSILERVGQLPLTLIGTSNENYHSVKKAFEEIIKPNKAPGAYTLRYLGANSHVPNLLDARLDGDLNLQQSGFSGQGIWRNLAVNPQWYEAGDKYAALTRYSSLSVSYIVGWLNDGTGYSNLGNTGTDNVTTMALAENGDLYIGGSFLNWDGIADADKIARYNRSTGTWSSLFTGGANNTINKIILLDDGDLIIVGNFTSIGGSALNRAARWDGSTLTGFSTGFNAEVKDVYFDYKRNKLYFGGAFTSAGGVANTAKVAVWDLTTGAFSAMGTGTNNTVFAVYVEEASGDVYIGGAFTTVNGSNYHGVARWDYADQGWHSIGTTNEGVNASCLSITGAAMGNIYFGGAFTETYAAGPGFDLIEINYIAKLAPGGTGNLQPLGNGVNGSVYFMKWDTTLNKLFLSGNFTLLNIGTISLAADRTAFWNGTTFEKFPLDFPGTAQVSSYARHANGDYYLGFDTSGTMIIPSALNSVTNTGTDDTKPIFVFDSSADVIGTEYAQLTTLTNRTTGAQINFNDLLILAGSIIYVDIAQGRVYRRTGQTLQDITPGVFRRDSDLTNFALAPGVNEILVAAPDANGTPTIDAYMLWRNKHWSLSGTAA